MTRTIWVDEDGNPVVDEGELALLRRPYDKANGDFNISARRWWALAERMSSDRWETICRSVSDRAQTILSEDAELRELLHRAEHAAQQRIQAQLEQLRSRAGASGDSGDRTDLMLEEQLADALISGVREPRVWLDSVGVIVLAREPPVGPGFVAEAAA